MVVFPMLMWLGLAVFFLVMELATVALLTIWFTVGALAAAAVCWFGGGTTLQIAAFLAVSLGLFLAIRPTIRKRDFVKTNVDSVIGSQGLVTEDINNVSALGRVKLGAMTWSARSTDGSPIPAGTTVRADRVEGVKVFVSVISNPII